ncbi:hypothetical protein E2C01_022246 [Portunus trituberculatus]|uniref:Uncharacterized protein n=1 Tax=Portunus trituberculatus TaxID=210409 RepID=A0A5B7E4V9_PORTR|nr:hypothetical protein [Portunus trituberculatus]
MECLPGDLSDSEVKLTLSLRQVQCPVLPTRPRCFWQCKCAGLAESSVFFVECVTLVRICTRQINPAAGGGVAHDSGLHGSILSRVSARQGCRGVLYLDPACGTLGCHEG